MTGPFQQDLSDQTAQTNNLTELVEQTAANNKKLLSAANTITRSAQGPMANAFLSHSQEIQQVCQKNNTTLHGITGTLRQGIALVEQQEGTGASYFQNLAPGANSPTMPPLLAGGTGGMAATNALTDADRAALKNYSGGGFAPLNNMLRHGPWNESKRGDIDALNRALNKLPPYQGEVYRGVNNFPKNELAKYQLGETVADPGFASSTKSTDIAKEYKGPVNFKIMSRTGRDITTYALDPTEEEVLFPPGTRFKVADRQDRPGGWYGEDAVDIILHDLGRGPVPSNPPT